MIMRLTLPLLMLLAGCARMEEIGRAPPFTPDTTSAERSAMFTPGPVASRGQLQEASLWRGGQASLLGDRRAMKRGDIMTVVIEIDDSAQISNSTSRSRSGSESLGIPNMLGLPQRIDNELLYEGATMGSAVGLDSSSSATGDGSVSRNEKLTLRVAATIVDVLPNGVLSISGNQEVRVNYELRELQVSGYVRPEDISRQNEITYDKIASARISYGGRGQISEVQQPRYGQQFLEKILPF
ncbi:flagellar basal body L-ring protein FlgH [Pseudooceanicola sp. CBS1P-1]|uniref:Flagellar L-ring protein n=1 Tax=Pseudooceanicola albus TaxID=2692189 RepID=A0A6L7G7M9_9RHOB|nr:MULTISPECIES: flagellar basal body L-ring protein FlgH [Pseudooceanicola]MBT9385860.1 flagellar basal body L-ring protein FlgH [Pseudooceanicola endophyticus]MXN20091.1 flagellar basal body L-ring protein FlgH [Pseudooceanicola albus]